MGDRSFYEIYMIKIKEEEERAISCELEPSGRWRMLRSLGSHEKRVQMHLQMVRHNVTISTAWIESTYLLFSNCRNLKFRSKKRKRKETFKWGEVSRDTCEWLGLNKRDATRVKWRFYPVKPLFRFITKYQCLHTCKERDRSPTAGKKGSFFLAIVLESYRIKLLRTQHRRWTYAT